MKYFPFYLKRISCKNSDEVFDYFIKNLKETITTWEYFVNWTKVFANVKTIAKEFWRVLKNGKYCGILIGDTRRKKYYQPLAYRVMQTFIDEGFVLKEDIIKHQWNCKATPYWANMSKKYNFLLIMHEHLFIFEKPKNQD